MRPLVLAALLFGSAAPLAAQGLGCSGAGGLAGYCGRTAQMAEIMLARTAIAAAAGNPVPGTASTLGMRLGSFPRFTISGRWGLARAELPRLRNAADDADHSASITALGLDASVGLYSGIPLGPTVGGFASVDLLASLVAVGLPDRDGLDGGSVHSWGLGARFGILRESFTAPGLSVSVMRRGFGEFDYGDGQLTDQDAFVLVENPSSWSVRAAAGKRVAGIGVTGGFGWDLASADVRVRVRDGTTAELSRRGFDADRFTVFGDASFTLLIFSAVLDAGWQSGGDGPEAGADYVSRGGLYGALAFRLAF